MNGKSKKKVVRIYGRVVRIEAVKVGKHACDAECRSCGHRYVHDFRSRSVQMFGLAPGQIYTVPAGDWPLLIV